MTSLQMVVVGGLTNGRLSHTSCPSDPSDLHDIPYIVSFNLDCDNSSNTGAAEPDIIAAILAPQTQGNSRAHTCLSVIAHELCIAGS